CGAPGVGAAGRESAAALPGARARTQRHRGGARFPRRHARRADGGGDGAGGAGPVGGDGVDGGGAMRLHSLEITGFGPFSGTQRVDFDDLGADGLFLLHGQTGAGKTTVLDAVAFALYGTVPGARQDGRRLRSDHAAPGTPTEVTLHATIAGRSLRLRRSPEYMRPKQRGTGETKEQARVTLEWVDGSGENLSRIPDVAAQVTRLLGMSAEQFFQVVLLPQGEFARFLKAETKTRAALLERLFDTGRF